MASWQTDWCGDEHVWVRTARQVPGAFPEAGGWCLISTTSRLRRRYGMSRFSHPSFLLSRTTHLAHANLQGVRSPTKTRALRWIPSPSATTPQKEVGSPPSMRMTTILGKIFHLATRASVDNRGVMGADMDVQDSVAGH
jgi:hypothetical protein